MKLHQIYYQWIKQSTKIIELRLYDEKRKKIKLWDSIEFTNQDNNTDSKLSKTVIWLLHYKTFEDIINDFELSSFWDRNNKQTLIDTLYTFYSKKNEKKYGIIGIRIK